MSDCKPCDKSFAQEHQDLISDVCYLKNVTLADKFVRVSPDDPESGYLSDKLIGVSGIEFYEDTNGVSGHTYVASLDLGYLDARYLGHKASISLGLNSGVHNGYVCFNRLTSDIQSLRYTICGNAASAFNFQLPQDFISSKNSDLKIRWAITEGVSGTAILSVEYNSVSVGGQLNLFQNEIVSGISDGIAYKMNEILIPMNTIIMNTVDQLVLKITRLKDSPSDNLAVPLEIVGVILDYNL